MNFQESVSFLDSLSTGGIRLGLENTRRILQYLGNPQEKVPSVHVAGTNGKGSTCAFVQSILKASGYKTGLYTSPHFLDIRERFQINGKQISQKKFSDLVCVVRRATEMLKLPVTYFEFGTVMAFLYFAEEDVDWSVIEVGLGGRLDATNLCKSRISIITSIALDHEKYLGSDLSEIGFEKASIIRKNGTVVADIQTEAVAKVVRDIVIDRRANLLQFGQDFNASRVFIGSRNQLMNYSDDKHQLGKLQVPLIGEHQIHNAGLAVSACFALKGEADKLTERSIRKGLESTQWPGRLEIVGDSPVILLDGAHNPESAKKMTVSLKEHFSFCKCIMIVAIMGDKAIEKITSILSETADQIILTGLQNSRAMDPKALREIFEKYDKPIEIIEEISYAISLAKKMAGPEDLICITGSLFTVAEAMRLFAHDSFS